MKYRVIKSVLKNIIIKNVLFEYIMYVCLFRFIYKYIFMMDNYVSVFKVIDFKM